jgi:hypothetical protein
MSNNSSLPKTISVSVNLSKIDPQFISQGKDGAKYLNLRLLHTPDSQYGNDYMVSQDLDKASRETAKASGDWPKTPILGNGKVFSGRPASEDALTPSQRQSVNIITQATDQAGSADDFPF